MVPPRGASLVQDTAPPMGATLVDDNGASRRSLVDAVAGYLMAAGSGVEQGVAGVMGMPADMGRTLRDSANKYIVDPTLKSVLGEPPAMPQGVKPAEGITSWGGASNIASQIPGADYKPQSTGEQYAQTVGSFLPGAALAPGGATAGNLIRYGMVPGLASEAAGQATKGTPYEQAARVGAALASPYALQVGERMISPFGGRISPERQVQTDVLAREGVPVSAGQATGSKWLKAAEDHLGNAPLSGGAAREFGEAQREAFTAAALKQAGGGQLDTLANPETLRGMKTFLGREYDALSKGKIILFDPQFGQDVGLAASAYKGLVPTQQQSPAIDRWLTDLMGSAGGMGGEQYQQARSMLTSDIKKAGDTALKSTLQDFKTALDSAARRSLPPEDAQRWAQVDREYANLKTLEKVATRAGSENAMGRISPQAYRQALATDYPQMYAYGGSPSAELARAGASILTDFPSSGTAERAAIMAIPGLVVGGGAGLATGNLAAAGIGAAGALLPGLAGRALMSGPAQSYLMNQMLSPPTSRATLQGVTLPALIEALNNRANAGR